MSTRPVTPETDEVDQKLDTALRPVRFTDFVGQRRSVENIQVAIRAAQQRGDTIDHILLSGPPGLGKTTLAQLVANELDTRLVMSSGPMLTRAGDLAGILTDLNEGDILFIDEVHRIPHTVAEYLYSAMEDLKIDILLDSGPNSRSINLNLKPFTLIGATTREGLLPEPFRARFGILEKLALYPVEDLDLILQRSANLMNVTLHSDSSCFIAERSRGTPRVANRYLRRVRDLAQLEADNVIDPVIAQKGLKMLGVDEAGLDGVDRQILEALIRHGGDPVGLKTISVTVGEETDTIEDVYEPYLIQQGFIRKTPRGRVPAPLAWSHLGRDLPQKVSSPEQPELFPKA